MKELINNVEQWAADKGILEHATTLRQAEKTLEECQELICAILNDEKTNNHRSLSHSFGGLHKRGEIK
jgi:hypothetical protein